MPGHLYKQETKLEELGGTILLGLQHHHKALVHFKLLLWVRTGSGSHHLHLSHHPSSLCLHPHIRQVP
jgi:hypothetical protein